ncbi:hypothetical protein [Sulfurimonas sp. HSL-1716]|uniref:hypothetical protein n=1 Tax=Hydrocurvibacter sulfurireducens TaxID=3131937 RepID=UPI0031F89286
MIRFLQALLTGVFFTFIYDFFIFLGIFQNYIKKYDIDLYYNILFADHQNFFIFALFTLMLGAVIVYLDNIKVSIIIISTLFVLSLLPLVPSIGEETAKTLLMQKNTTLHVGKYTYSGDLYYNGRKEVYFFDKELNKILRFKKEDIKDEAYK